MKKISYRKRIASLAFGLFGAVFLVFVCVYHNKTVYPERNSVNPAGYGIRRDIHSVDRAEKSDSSCYDKRTEQQSGYFVTLWRFPLRPSVGKKSAGKRHRGLHPRCILSGAVVWWNRGGRTADPIH